MEVRYGHLISIYTILKNPFYFLFGQDPGSVFFTKGTLLTHR
jgi:hypothetical protein